MHDFLLEEYKQLHSQIQKHQESYLKVEGLTIGGLVIAYGFMFSNSSKMPLLAWWGIFALVCVAAVRAFAYYWIINKSLAAYLIKIEQHAYKRSKFKGYQTTFSDRLIGRTANLIFNSLVWMALILGSGGLALFHKLIVAP